MIFLFKIKVWLCSKLVPEYLELEVIREIGIVNECISMKIVSVIVFGVQVTDQTSFSLIFFYLVFAQIYLIRRFIYESDIDCDVFLETESTAVRCLYSNSKEVLISIQFFFNNQLVLVDLEEVIVLVAVSLHQFVFKTSCEKPSDLTHVIRIFSSELANDSTDRAVFFHWELLEKQAGRGLINVIYQYLECLFKKIAMLICGADLDVVNVFQFVIELFRC